jgi:hypothetical protein
MPLFSGAYYLLINYNKVTYLFITSGNVRRILGSHLTLTKFRNPQLLGRLEVSPAIDSRPDCITPGTHWIGGSNDKNGLYPTTQSQSHITTDDLSVSVSWFRAPSWAHDQILITV